MEILEEPISSNYRNAGLRLRRKLPHKQKIFEDRLASVVLQRLGAKIHSDQNMMKPQMKNSHYNS